MSKFSPQLVALKVEFQNEIHRVRIDISEYSFEQLIKLFSSKFSLSEESFTVEFTNMQMQKVNVKDPESFEEACVLYLKDDAEIEGPTSFRFIAQQKSTASLHEASEPILRAIEKLVAQLTEMMEKLMEKVREEDWEGKCKQGISVANEHCQRGFSVANEHCKQGISVANEQCKQGISVASEQWSVASVKLQKAAEETKVHLNECKARVNELPVGEFMKETAEGIKVAALEISTFAQEFARQVNLEYQNATEEQVVAPEQVNEVAATEEQVATEEAPEQVAAPEQVQVQTKDEVEETETTASSDDEWDVVACASEEEKKWKAELSMLTEIFPQAEKSVVLALLEEHKGNMQMVLNAVADL